MFVYKHRRVIWRIVSIAKTPKLSPRINLGISSDLGITNPRFILLGCRKDSQEAPNY